MIHVITWIAIIGGSAFLVWGCKGFPIPFQAYRKRSRGAFSYGRPSEDN